MKRGDKRRHNPGRPSEGLLSRVDLRVTPVLLDQVRKAAARRGLTLTEWWREAAQMALEAEKAK